jgi:hypothetical protein
MRPHLVPKEIRDHVVKATVEIDVRSFRIDKSVAIAAADGAIADRDFVVCEGLGSDGECYGATVTVGEVGGQF